MTWFGLAAALLVTGPVSAETVPSLEQVPAHLVTPEAKATYAQQMNGDIPPDRLGARHLPDGLSEAALARLLVPAGDTAALRLVGARHWHDDLYVAIACTGGAGPMAPGEPQCAYSDDPKATMHVYLGVLAMAPGAPPRLLAASGDWNPAVDWGSTLLPRVPDEAGGSPILPQTFDGFDLANYVIAPGNRAFGLRCGWINGYSGGSASFTGLYLFAVDGARLRLVLATPMSAFADIAGDWHKDGTRDHDITQASNLLVISHHQTAGHFDLELRQRGGKGRQVFRWAQAQSGYRPVSP